MENHVGKMRNGRNPVVKNHDSATKKIMICGLFVQMASDKKIFHSRPPPLFCFKSIVDEKERDCFGRS